MILLILVSTLLDSMASQICFDSLVYPLTLPHICLNAHRLVYSPQILFWGMPQSAEMLYTWALRLSDQSGALVLGWMAGGIVLIGILEKLLEVFGEDAVWVAVAAIVSGHTMAFGLAWGCTDLRGRIMIILTYLLIFWGICRKFLATDQWDDQLVQGLIIYFPLTIFLLVSLCCARKRVLYPEKTNHLVQADVYPEYWS